MVSMPLQAADWEAINCGLTPLYSKLDSEKHSRVMLQTINDLVPADSLAINLARFDKPHDLSAMTFPENHVTPEQLALLGKFAHQSPFASCHLAAMESNWKMITDFMPVEDFHNTDLHRLALGPLGINHQMFGVLEVPGETGCAITINRTVDAFTERDRKVLNTLHPHLVTSFFNAAAHSRAQRFIGQLKAAMDCAPGAYGHFDLAGKLVWIQDHGAAWLKEFFSEEAGREGELPRPVQKLIERSNQNRQAPQFLAKDCGHERLTVRLGSDALGGWTLSLHRKRALSPPHFRPIPQLSQRQNEVLKWMAEGKRNSEIGIILNLSTRTVENHVQSILKVLKLENRSTAIVYAIDYCAAMDHEMPLAPPEAPIP